MYIFTDLKCMNILLLQIKQCTINVSLSPCIFRLSCFSFSFARWKEEYAPTLHESSWINDWLKMLLSLARATSLGAKPIDSLVRFLFLPFFNGVTDKSRTCLLYIGEVMSQSGNTGAGNKFFDFEEAQGWSEETLEVPSSFCCSLATLASVTKSYLLTPENPILLLFLILFLSYLFFLSFFFKIKSFISHFCQYNLQTFNRHNFFMTISWACYIYQPTD